MNTQFNKQNYFFKPNLYLIGSCRKRAADFALQYFFLTIKCYKCKENRHIVSLLCGPHLKISKFLSSLFAAHSVQVNLLVYPFGLKSRASH